MAEIKQFPPVISSVTQNILEQMHVGLYSYLEQKKARIINSESIFGQQLSQEVQQVMARGIQLVGEGYLRNQGEQMPFYAIIPDSESFTLILAQRREKRQIHATIFIEDGNGLVNNRLTFLADQKIDDGVLFDESSQIETPVNEYLNAFANKKDITVQRLYINPPFTITGGDGGERAKAA